jgi:hypothetical protein
MHESEYFFAQIEVEMDHFPSFGKVIELSIKYLLLLCAGPKFYIKVSLRSIPYI